MIRLNIADPVFKMPGLPESIFDKIEAIDLKRALNPMVLPFVCLTDDEYSQICNNVIMSKIEIRVSDFYGVPAYYSEMPQEIFDALELAALKDEEFALVDKAQFDKMIADYKIKMNHE
ncbi:MAG: hypothetical protein NC110_00020 [Ruminococcus sp.]|nr:hypothetical protein [Ruminococcus sp.]MCM1543661.1 hypothetical protein [Ruminococcus sp.]